jgi:hypothetical protein
MYQRNSEASVTLLFATLLYTGIQNRRKADRARPTAFMKILLFADQNDFINFEKKYVRSF